MQNSDRDNEVPKDNQMTEPQRRMTIVVLATHGTFRYIFKRDIHRHLKEKLTSQRQAQG